MKLYVILERNDSGGWSPTRVKDMSAYGQTKAFTNIYEAKRSMSVLKANWPGEYKVTSYVEEN